VQILGLKIKGQGHWERKRKNRFSRICNLFFQGVKLNDGIAVMIGCVRTCRVEISEQLVVSLTVVESTLEDAGEYTVRVYNEFGEATSTTQVNVLFEAPTFTVPLTDQQVR